MSDVERTILMLKKNWYAYFVYERCGWFVDEKSKSLPHDDVTDDEELNLQTAKYMSIESFDKLL